MTILDVYQDSDVEEGGEGIQSSSENLLFSSKSHSIRRPTDTPLGEMMMEEERTKTNIDFVMKRDQLFQREFEEPLRVDVNPETGLDPREDQRHEEESLVE